MLVIPTFEGVKVSIDGEIHFREMTPGELLNLGLRFIEASKEAAMHRERKLARRK
jgi:hypothetical protein